MPPSAFDQIMTRPSLVPGDGAAKRTGTKSQPGLDEGSKTPSLKRRKVDTEPEPEAEGTKDISSHPSATGEQGKLSGAEFLRALTDHEAISLWNVVDEQYNWHNTTGLGEAEYSRLRTLRARQDGATHSGQWWVELIKCTRTGTEVASDHQRWQVDVTGQGPRCAMAKVRRALSEQSLTRFLSLATTGTKKKVALQAHHVRYNADVTRRHLKPLPLDAGKGGSISHLCDQTGCVRLSHLEVSIRHIDNLERQRCRGATIIYVGDTILLEKPCAHAQAGLEPEAALMNSCLGKIALTCLDEVSASDFSLVKLGRL